MRVKPGNDALKSREKIKLDLARARELSPHPEPVCRPECPQYDSNTGCNRSCTDIARQLSSEGDRYPIEGKVAPLAFEIKRFGLFEPCWSCEGHDNAYGTLWKKPRVWFYADSVVHVRALTDAVNELNASRKLSTLWGVVITHSDLDNPSTTFSLEPLEPDSLVGVEPLHLDLIVLADELHDLFRKACELLENNAG